MSSAQEIMNQLHAMLLASSELSSKLDSSYKFVLRGDGSESGGEWVLTGGSNPTLSTGSADVAATIECSVDTICSIFQGKINPQVAFLKNDLQVNGDHRAILDLVHLWP